MRKKCANCAILLDVLCTNPACDGHHNESVGNVCVYCATNGREKVLFFVRVALHLTVVHLTCNENGDPDILLLARFHAQPGGVDHGSHDGILPQ